MNSQRVEEYDMIDFLPDIDDLDRIEEFTEKTTVLLMSHGRCKKVQHLFFQWLPISTCL
jgi:hypothetical protein